MDTLLAIHDNHTFWVWIALAGALLAAEVATGSGWLLWPAASAAVIGVVAKLAGLPAFTAVLAFAALTVVTPRAARRFMPALAGAEGDDINDNIVRLVGHHGQAVQAFEGGSGRVFIDGKEWAAQVEGGGPVAAGAKVEVTGVSGARLQVRGA